MGNLQAAKEANGYINSSFGATNGLGKHVILTLTVWQKRQKFEIYTSRTIHQLLRLKDHVLDEVSEDFQNELRHRIRKSGLLSE